MLFETSTDQDSVGKLPYAEGRGVVLTAKDGTTSVIFALDVKFLYYLKTILFNPVPQRRMLLFSTLPLYGRFLECSKRDELWIPCRGALIIRTCGRSFASPQLRLTGWSTGFWHFTGTINSNPR